MLLTASAKFNFIYLENVQSLFKDSDNVPPGNPPRCH